MTIVVYERALYVTINAIYCHPILTVEVCKTHFSLNVLYLIQNIWMKFVCVWGNGTFSLIVCKNYEVSRIWHIDLGLYDFSQFFSVILHEYDRLSFKEFKFLLGQNFSLDSCFLFLFCVFVISIMMHASTAMFWLK